MDRVGAGDPASASGVDDTRQEQPAPLSERALVPGSVLSERFRIVRFIAAGGMGSVYEAEDLELKDRVALKTIRPDIIADARVLRRFKQEIYLSRKITHQNVCRVFDLWRHKWADTDSADLVFVTMELLRGETLAALLRREGPLEISRAAGIATQVARGLDAVHAAGIVHRDLKPGNVMLVADVHGDPRVVVSDFGLARRSSFVDQTTRTASETLFEGTPAYMAPEQIEGAPITNRTDVYAFGLILYEMVCGCPPFDEPTPIQTALKRLSASPSSPKTHRPTLPDSWESVILRCLERQPERRFASTVAAVDALQNGHPAIEPMVRPAATWQRGALAALFICVVLVGGAIWTYLQWHANRPQGTLERTTTNPRPSLAVVGFRNVTARPDAQWISTALSEALGSQIAQSQRILVIRSDSVARMKQELDIVESDRFEPDTLRRIRQNVGADFALLGAYDEQNGQIRLTVRVQRTSSGETVAHASIAAPTRDFLGLVEGALGHIHEQLGIDGPPPQQRLQTRTSLPSRPDAMRAYAEGIDALQTFSALKARDLLSKAVELEPDFPRGHAALAAAWSLIGNDGKALESARVAYQLSNDLSPEDRLLIEAQFREAAREWEAAIKSYRTLVSTAPDNLEYALALVNAQLNGPNPADAFNTIERLRHLPAPTADDPRLDFYEAAAAEVTGDFERQRHLAVSAGEKGRTQRAPALTARALLIEASALGRLGHVQTSIQKNQEARALFEDAKDARGVARALIQLGTLYQRQRRFELARTSYAGALARTERLGELRYRARALTGLGNVLFQLGQLDEAHIEYERALALNRDIDDKSAVAQVLTNLASLFYHKGEIVRANALDTESLEIKRQLGDRRGVAFSLVNMAEVAADQGRVEEAERLYREALALNQEMGNKAEIAYSLTGLGQVLLQKADMAGAGEAHRNALVLREEMKEAGAANESRLLIAETQLELSATSGTGDIRSLIATFEKCAQIADQGSDRATAAKATALLALALLQTGEIEAARQAGDRAARALPEGAAPEIEFPVRLAGASIEAAVRKPEQALRSMDILIAECRRRSLTTYELGARIARAEILVGTGRQADAAVEIQSVQSEARRLGLKLLEQKAARLVRVRS